MTETTTRPTMSELARTAGVSLPTFSKVLNGRPGVSKSMRERVTLLLTENGYVPRRAPGRDGGTIELVLGELESPWALSIVRAMENAAYAEGLGVTLSRIRSGDPGGWLSMLSSRAPRGIVFGVVETSAAEQTRLRELGIPFVVIDPEGNHPMSVPTVGIAHWRGALDATNYLISLGHREIATIGGPLRLLCSRARVDGFRAALSGAGLPLPADYVTHVDYSFEAGYAAAARLLAQPTPPTAIFAASDEQALGVYEAARLAHLRVPDDISVIGFNDAPIAHWASPPLTTVREPIDDMARHAVELLSRLREGEVVGPAVELATALVVRESTAPPPAAHTK